ncbi:MAG: hypothetical protein ACYS7Y_29130 [Planctomycetota bacterium]|jgi:hypothetical protein
MARYQTPPVIVVEGDDAPDLYVSLQQDSTGNPLNLTDRAAFVVVSERGDLEEYEFKFQAEIVDAENGQIKISWIKDPILMTSYLSDLTAGVSYELQVFLGRTNLPPSYIDIVSSVEYFPGRYYFNGQWQEGSPVFKHSTEDLFLSRSPYDGGGPNEYVWLVTSLRAATWDEVKTQDKSTLLPADLAVVPIWNAKQVLIESVADSYALYPKNEIFEPDDPFITSVAKYNPTPNYEVIACGTSGALGTYILSNRNPDVDGFHFFNQTLDPAYVIEKNTANGYCVGTGSFEFLATYDVTGATGDATVPLSGWTNQNAPTADPAPTLVEVDEHVVWATNRADLPTDVENRGTQTVLTTIPLKVERAFRLADES